MAVDVSKGFGLERIARSAYLTLFASLNSELAFQTSLWIPLDQELANKKSVVYTPITLEKINKRNFYLGHRPSLVEAPVDEYPNVSVMAYQAQPLDEQLDHLMTYRPSMFVETMVKSLKDEHEVNARIQRTTEAVNNVILRDRTLGGTVFELGESPSVAVSDVFVRREEKGQGPEWYWQGSRIEYGYVKYSLFT